MNKKFIFRRLKTLVLVAALVAVSGVLASHNNVARAAAKASYTVAAGTGTDYGVDLLAFTPGTLRVHRGDTITWKFSPIHTVHFAAKPSDFAIVSDIDGQQIPEFTPAILMPSGASGDAFKEGFNSGLLGDPSGPTIFSVVMDVAPGSYTYLCDLQQGMVGTILVLADSETIDAPEKVDADAQLEAATELNTAQVSALKASDSAIPLTTEPTLSISAGFSEAKASINRYFPSVGGIQAGPTIQGTVPPGLEPHTLTFPLPDDYNIPPSAVPLPDKQNIPHPVSW